MIQTMKHDQSKGFLSNQFLLSIILHLLLLISVLLFVTAPEEEKKSPEYYVNSYVYQPPITSSVHQQKASKVHTPQFKPQKKLTLPPIQEQHVATHALPHTQKNISMATGSENKSIMAMSLDALKQNQIQHALQQPKDEEPILLIGDSTLATDPFIKLIGRSLSANFTYPELEGRMGIKGSVLVELIIHPEGYYTDIHILRPSESQNFNNAALYAINKAPQAVGVDRFLSKPKRLVVGFIFN
ncbi:MAG: energy transducer TonB [Gammaproteobacteria bacterium]